MIQMNLQNRKRLTDLENNLMAAGGGGEGIVRDFRKVMYTLIYYNGEPTKTCSMLCPSLDGRGGWGRVDTCMCTAESLHCSPKSTTKLLIGYAPIENEKFKVWKKINKM